MDEVNYRPHIAKIAADDAKVVVDKDIQYGASWCKRGGVGAFMVAVRKIDRIEQRVEKYGWDIFKAVGDDQRAEGLIDDIRDLRGYLLLWEGWLIEKGVVAPRYGVDAGQAPAHLLDFGSQRGPEYNQMVDWDVGRGRCHFRFFGDPGKQCTQEEGHEGNHVWGKHNGPNERHSGDATGRC